MPRYMDTVFRIATPDDLGSINAIYNQAILARHQTADLETYPLEQTQEWFTQHDIDLYPVFVIEADGQVIGWSSLSSYRKGRQALKAVAEISYYIDSQHQRKGLGSLLIEQTINSASDYGFEILVAILLDTNTASKAILSKFGFAEWGRIFQAAQIERKRVDHLYYGKRLP